MSYQALYRKWRPTDFKDVKGQDHIVCTLQNQIKADRIGHAYLFCGTRGTGKTTIAKILAKAVNCEHPIDGNPCGECPTCKAIAAGTSMNVIEIDAASNNGVDNIREIREEVQYSPTEGKYKVYIIDEVHMLSIGAFNALLKTLEEPPSYVIFILATTEAHKIPVTILSRCQRYDFHRISIETIADRLSHLMREEKIAVEDKAVRYIAKVADGSMRDALSLLDQCIAFYLGKDLKYDNVLNVLGAVDTTVFSDMLKLLLGADAGGCMEFLSRIIMQGRDLSQFVSDFIWYLRNLLLVKTTDDDSKLEDIIDVSDDSLKQLAKEAELVDADTLMRYIRVLSDLSNDLRYATQKRIKVEVALIKLAKPAMEQSTDVGDIISRLTVLEAQLQETKTSIKNGVVVSPSVAGAAAHGVITGDVAGNSESAQLEESVAKEKKRIAEALPEDIKAIASKWDSIIYSIEDAMLKSMLSSCNITLSRDNTELELVVYGITAYGMLSAPKRIEEIEALIEERTGIHVPVIVSKGADGEDYRNRMVDIRDAIAINMEVDDEEEYI